MLEKLLFKKVEVWVLIATVLVGTVFTIVFGWGVMYRSSGGDRGGLVGDLLLDVASIPDPLIRAVLSKGNIFQPQIISFDEFSGFKKVDSRFADTGMLLVSSYSADHRVSTVYLYDIENDKRLFEWVPPVDEINANATRPAIDDPVNEKKSYRTQHPLLMDNGDLIFSSGEGPLVRIDMCGNLKWVVDYDFHHSIEVGSNGNLFVPVWLGKSTDGADNPVNDMRVPIRDDGIAEITPDGEIVNNWSIRDILEKHGYHGLLYGTSPYENDRIHLNDIEPILESDDFVEKGDLALSLRHTSTVFLYRPSTDEIVWLKTGPWLIQHDVDYQGDGVFTIFGNDGIRNRHGGLRGYSTIWSYNQKDESVTAFQELKDPGIYSESQGLHTVLSNGDIFVEEQNSHILHRVNGSKLRWSYVNTLSKGKIGALHWSRYLDPKMQQLDWMEKASCLQKT